MRQTIFGLAVNIVQSLASSPAHGEMDSSVLQRSLQKLQTKEMVAYFGLTLTGSSTDLARGEDESFLTNVEEITKFLSEVLDAGATSVGESK